ncbi:21258_t:CDS:2, partial [Racocetra persica]
PMMKRSAKTKKGEKDSTYIRDIYLQLENELQREMEHLRLILSHIDNQKSKLKTEETVLLAMLGDSNDTTSHETSNETSTSLCFTDLNMESELNLIPEVPGFSSLELPDVGSSDLSDLQEKHMNLKSIDLDIANALSILENMSDCEAEDVEQTAQSPQSEESWKEPIQQSSTYDSDDDHEI